jgi:hypothetical protein
MKTLPDFDFARSPQGLGGQANPSGRYQRRYQQWLTSAIKMMMGIGTPSSKSKIERIVNPPPQFV